MTARLALLFVLAFLCGPPLAAQNAASRACAGCHQQIWTSYQQTGMGRSFQPPTAANVATGAYYHAPSASHFEILQRDGRFYQRRHQLDAAGQPINVFEKAIDYVMGSGNHARTYLYRTPANTLFELPLGWFAEKGGFLAMNPGYDRPNHDGFRRPITFDCMFCHNAYPSVPAASSKPFASAVYGPQPLPEGIGCARCHGDAARHMELAAAKAPAPAIRQAVVNPGRLPADRQLDLCYSCHLESTSFPLPNAIQRYNRPPFSFRPGEPLADFLLNFDHAPNTGHQDKFEIVNAGYRMRQSACFLKSNGKLLCTSCHNPHSAPRGAEATLHYDRACRQCHQQPTASHAALGPKATENCAACHMPRRRTEDVIHVTATDHLIQRQPPPGDLLAPRQEIRDVYAGPVVPYYPATLPPGVDSQLYLAVAQVKQSSNLKAGITQLAALLARHAPARAEWYIELGDALLNDAQPAAAAKAYQDATRRDASSAYAWQKLGTALRRAARPAEALPALERAATLDPARAVTWHELSHTRSALGQPAAALAAMQRALQADPDMPEAHNNLGILQVAASPAQAEQAFRQALRIKPDYADAQANLARLLAATNRSDEAAAAFATALALTPASAAASATANVPLRYEYAMLLGAQRHYDDAQSQLEECIRRDARFAPAHQTLGDLAMAQGSPLRAVVHYRELMRLQPGSAGAALLLGTALLESGDRAGALPHLRRAAASNDANIRQRAQQLLQ